MFENRRGLILIICELLFIFFSSACAILSYSPSAPSTVPNIEPNARREFLTFAYLSKYSGRPEDDRSHTTLTEESQIIMDLFSQHLGFLKVVTTPRPPDVGTHINVYQTDGPPPSSWCRAAAWTFDLLPCYADGIVYETHFDVYVDNTLKNAYRYEISRKGVSWIGLLPFVWTNFFTTQYRDAFSATVYQFIADATRDRVLQTKD